MNTKNTNILICFKQALIFIYYINIVRISYTYLGSKITYDKQIETEIMIKIA